MNLYRSLLWDFFFTPSWSVQLTHEAGRGDEQANYCGNLHHRALVLSSWSWFRFVETITLKLLFCHPAEQCWDVHCCDQKQAAAAAERQKEQKGSFCHTDSLSEFTKCLSFFLFSNGQLVSDDFLVLAFLILTKFDSCPHWRRAIIHDILLSDPTNDPKEKINSRVGSSGMTQGPHIYPYASICD